jgi:hypothetical protein
MNRRSFISGIAALVGGVALNEVIPFGRVRSFPKVIRIAQPDLISDYLGRVDAGIFLINERYVALHLESHLKDIPYLIYGNARLAEVLNSHPSYPCV